MLYNILKKPFELSPEVIIPRKLGVFFWFTTLIFILAISYFTISIINQREKLFSYDINATHISSICWEKTDIKGVVGYLWLADWFTQKIYRYKITSLAERIISANVVIYELPGVHPGGLVLTPNCIWVCDSWKKKILQYKLTPAFMCINEYSLPSNSPTGLAFDGAYIWSCDSYTDTIYRHRLDSKLTIVEAYRTPGDMPVGVAWDGEYLWSVDANTRRSYKHDVYNKMSIIDTVGLEKIPLIVQPISGFAIFNNSFWLSYENVSKLFKMQYKQSFLFTKF